MLQPLRLSRIFLLQKPRVIGMRYQEKKIILMISNIKGRGDK